MSRNNNSTTNFIKDLIKNRAELQERLQEELLELNPELALRIIGNNAHTTLNGIKDVDALFLGKAFVYTSTMGYNGATIYHRLRTTFSKAINVSASYLKKALIFAIDDMRPSVVHSILCHPNASKIDNVKAIVKEANNVMGPDFRFSDPSSKKIDENKDTTIKDLVLENISGDESEYPDKENINVKLTPKAIPDTTLQPSTSKTLSSQTNGNKTIV